MGWRRETFMQNYESLGVAYHCPRGSVDYFELAGLAAIDIDNEEDFLLADVHMSQNQFLKKRHNITNQKGLVKMLIVIWKFRCWFGPFKAFCDGWENVMAWLKNQT